MTFRFCSVAGDDVTCSLLNKGGCFMQIHLGPISRIKSRNSICVSLREICHVKDHVPTQFFTYISRSKLRAKKKKFTQLRVFYLHEKLRGKQKSRKDPGTYAFISRNFFRETGPSCLLHSH